MIVSTNELADLRGRVTMVSGGFDPIHPGHVDYFRAASELGVPVLCNVTGDEWVAQKHPPLLTQDERAAVIDALRWIDYTHIAHTSTAGVLHALCPRYFAKGVDWRDRLPADEVEACAEHGIEVVFLDTVTSSSTAVLDRYEQRLRGR